MASNNINDYSQGVDTTLANQPAKRQVFNQGQKAEESDYLSRFRNAVMGQEALPALSERLSQELGLPELRKTTLGLTQSYNALPETYSKAVRGFDVNANQLNRIVATQQGKMAPALQAATTAQTAAEADLDKRIGYAQTQQAKELLPFQSEQSLMSDRMARESTGFNQDSEKELTALLQKMQSGVQLSIAEQDRANQLAIAEKSYQAAKYKADQDLAAARLNSLVNLASKF